MPRAIISSLFPSLCSANLADLLSPIVILIASMHMHEQEIRYYDDLLCSLSLSTLLCFAIEGHARARVCVRLQGPYDGKLHLILSIYASENIERGRCVGEYDQFLQAIPVNIQIYVRWSFFLLLLRLLIVVVNN